MEKNNKIEVFAAPGHYDMILVKKLSDDYDFLWATDPSKTYKNSKPTSLQTYDELIKQHILAGALKILEIYE